MKAIKRFKNLKNIVFEFRQLESGAHELLKLLANMKSLNKLENLTLKLDNDNRDPRQWFERLTRPLPRLRSLQRLNLILSEGNSPLIKGEQLNVLARYLTGLKKLSHLQLYFYKYCHTWGLVEIVNSLPKIPTLSSVHLNLSNNINRICNPEGLRLGEDDLIMLWMIKLARLLAEAKNLSEFYLYEHPGWYLSSETFKVLEEIIQNIKKTIEERTSEKLTTKLNAKSYHSRTKDWGTKWGTKLEDEMLLKIQLERSGELKSNETKPGGKEM